MALRINDLAAYRTLILSLIRHEGLAGFLKGLGPNVLGIFIYKGNSFFLYENLNRHIMQSKWIGKSYLREFASAAVAAISAQALTYPFDVIKRRYMVLRDRRHQLGHQSH